MFLSRIRARDCKPLDIQEKNPWVVCGKAWSHYVEKLTGERRPRSDKTAGGCAGPATWMRSNGTRQAVILPGSLDVTRMERL